MQSTAAEVCGLPVQVLIADMDTHFGKWIAWRVVGLAWRCVITHAAQLSVKQASSPAYAGVNGWMKAASLIVLLCFAVTSGSANSVPRHTGTSS